MYRTWPLRRNMPVMEGRMWISLLVVGLLTLTNVVSGYQIIYAVNCGGFEAHTDANGIEYEKDALEGVAGTSSHYGAQWLYFDRVPEQDNILYQTERYSQTTFGYSLPVAGEGKYLLVLKFCEVYFREPNQKVFDVTLNEEHVIVSELDIFQQVGHATAHEEQISFTISRGKLYVNNEVSEIRGGRIKVQFIKGQLDNPKINAIVLAKGSDLHLFPKLPAKQQQVVSGQPAGMADLTDAMFQPFTDDVDDNDETDERLQRPKTRKTSGPKQPDPYANQGQTSLLTVVLFISVATIIPLLILRCKV